MINLPMASILIGILSVIWVLCSLMLILIILVQKGKGGGLGGAFGGAGGGGGLLGTKTGDFLTWFTISLVIIFFALAIILIKFGKPKISEDLMDSPSQQMAAPADIEGDDQEVPSDEGQNAPVVPDTEDDKAPAVPTE